MYAAVRSTMRCSPSSSLKQHRPDATDVYLVPRTGLPSFAWRDETAIRRIETEVGVWVRPRDLELGHASFCDLFAFGVCELV